ncbi:ABC transporter permease [Nonomuraea aurantiaca]|uniref:ABC transporter permease n=1 Tax=Nonomuraea aurantiaca TaxID=2878562 RepID=UPI001CD9C5D7|nr:ABC transporter permease [Nonomuraea aurantiaca]MCA2228848.1 ABC transporter permease [Nonomuraea aurantiaca]
MTAFAGTGLLVRLVLRRDRLLLPVWVVAIGGVVSAIASAITSVYADPAQRLALGAMISGNPAMRALTGPVFDPTSVGGLIAWRATTIAAVLTALMSILLVTRHTRAEEESGRAELIGAGAVGRHALPAAAVLVASLANLATGLLIGLGLSAQGLPAAGSLALGLAIAGVGWVFTGLSVLAAQLTEGARTANAIACSALALCFLVRAAGDAADVEAVSWLSPLGWAQRLRPFAGERWWVPALIAVAGLLLLGASGLLARRRDLGAGMMAPRSGPANAAHSLRSPLALAWRLHRGALLAWTIGFAVAGAVFGTLAESMRDIVSDNPRIAELISMVGGGDTLVDTFFATELGLCGVVAGGYAVQAALRSRTEEAAARAEPVLSTAVPRWRWLAGHLAFALLGSAVILAVTGFAAGLTHGLRTGQPLTEAVRILGAALVQVPAVWVLAGLAVLLFGALPKLTALTWAALVTFVLLGQLGQLLQIDERVRAISPYFHLPQVPGGQFSAVPLVWLAGVAALLALAGIAAFGRRDLSGD